MEATKRATPDEPNADSESKRPAPKPAVRCVWRLRSWDIEDVIDYGVDSVSVVELLKGRRLVRPEGPEIFSHIRPVYRSSDLEIVVTDESEDFESLASHVLTDGPGASAVRAFKQFLRSESIESDDSEDSDEDPYVLDITGTDYGYDASPP